MERVRLIIDSPADGAWNMALDEALLATAANRQIATLRFYFWQRPTLSLGYFQSLDQRREHLASRDCPLVRRSTGGGAILHDRELTYSFTAPLSHKAALATALYYRTFHQTLIDALAHWEVRAEICGNRAASTGGDLPFLCFARRSEEDILLDGAKICGSAQRRRQGGLLQHGSLLLAASPHAPELPGITEISHRQIDPSDLMVRWRESLEDALGACFYQEDLSIAEATLAERIAADKFATTKWNGRR